MRTPALPRYTDYNMGVFGSFKKAMSKTRDFLSRDVRDVFAKGIILDEARIAELEKALISTDMGVQAADQIIEKLREEHGGRTVVYADILDVIKSELSDVLKGDGDVRYDLEDPLSPLALNPDGTTVILVTGVNGAGKTTSIAKLAHFLVQEGKSVLLAAGDTFRAAAVEQLQMWSDRIGCDIVTKPAGSDPASVAYAGCERARETGVDVLIVDTAGRLQTSKNLMDELTKIHRVIEKQIPGAPHETLQVLDATVGQNALSQAEKFSEAATTTGIILAKLDGTAKGGIVVAIRQKIGIPVKYIGLGEQIDQLAQFDPEAFLDAFFQED